MRFHIKATGFDLTPALNQFIEEKFSGFSKYVSRWDAEGAVILRIEIAKTTNHHNKGNIFYAEANFDLPKKMIRIEETNEDMRIAIDVLRDRLKNELLKVKEKESDH